jgi:hypothetical protein
MLGSLLAGSSFRARQGNACLVGQHTVWRDGRQAASYVNCPAMAAAVALRMNWHGWLGQAVNSAVALSTWSQYVGMGNSGATHSV